MPETAEAKLITSRQTMPLLQLADSFRMAKGLKNGKPDNIGQMMIDTTRTNPIDTDRLREGEKSQTKDGESSFRETSVGTIGPVLRQTMRQFTQRKGSIEHTVES